MEGFVYNLNSNQEKIMHEFESAQETKNKMIPILLNWRSVDQLISCKEFLTSLLPENIGRAILLVCEFSTTLYRQNKHNPIYATVTPETARPITDSAYRQHATLKKRRLSWPVAATRSTDSAAPSELARQAKKEVAESCEICQWSGSTGTATFIWRKRRPRMAREQRSTMKTSANRETMLELR